MTETGMNYSVRIDGLMPHVSIIILFLISCSVIAGTIRMSRGIKDSLLSNQKQPVRVTSTGFALNCPLQNLEADIHPDGVTIRSNSAKEGIGKFSIVPISLGRKTSQANIISNSIISTQDDSSVMLDRDMIIERFSSGADGIQQDFIIPEKLHGEGILSLFLKVKNADVAIGNGDIAITLQAGRKLVYGNCRVFDASGKPLVATMATVSGNRIRITVDDHGAKYPVTIDPTITDADWEVMNGDGILGTDGNVLTMTYKNGYLYIGGEFTKVGSARAKNIARWNGSKWEPFGTEIKGPVQSLLFNGDKDLIAVTPEGGFVQNILLWNGVEWKKIGLIYDDSPVLTNDNQGNLIMGGQFDSIIIGTKNNELVAVQTINIARWNGSTWEQLGNGLSSSHVTALTCDVNGIIYAATEKYTDTITGSELNVQKWDGNTWRVIASEMYKNNRKLNCLTCDRTGNLYMGGQFDTIAGIPAQNVARWNGTSWSALGTGLRGIVNSLAIDQNGILYSNGFFESQSQYDIPGVARWDGNSWSVLGTGAYPISLAVNEKGTLFICGNGMTIGSLVVNQLAQWDGSNWSALGKGIDGKVTALSIDAKGNLICGGTFTSIHGINANHIVKWDGSNWSALGKGTDGEVTRLNFDCKGNLYVSGNFNMAGGKPARRIAQWDGSQWQSLGNGINGEIAALSADCNANLYVGGLFDTAGTVPVKNIAQWNGTTWLPLGAGLNAKVNALYHDGQNLLCAGGAFTLSGNDSIHYLAEWNGSSWTEIWPDLDTVIALTGNVTGDLYIAIGGVVGILRKSGNQWIEGPDSDLLFAWIMDVCPGTTIDQLAFDKDGNIYFKKSNGIFRWNGTQLDGLICDTDPSTKTFAVSGNAVYVGGDFFGVRGTASASIAKFYFNDTNSISEYRRTLSVDNSIRFRLVGSKLVAENFINGDRIALYSVSGVLLREGICELPLNCKGIARQPVVIRINRSGRTVCRGMMFLR